MSSDAAPAADKPKRSRFLLRTPENGDLNQYWYSLPTIDAIVSEVVEQCALDDVPEATLGCALISTPSIYFSIADMELRAKCVVSTLPRALLLSSPHPPPHPAGAASWTWTRSGKRTQGL